MHAHYNDLKLGANKILTWLELNFRQRNLITWSLTFDLDSVHNLKTMVQFLKEKDEKPMFQDFHELH